MEKFPDLPSLPWRTFGPELRNLLTAVVNKLDREWPAKWQGMGSAKYLLESLARVTENTYHTIWLLCFDKPKWPATREDVLSVGPLTRTILDTLFTIIFAFEDLPTRATWYFKGGWREMWEEQQLYAAKYAGDSKWDEWLKERQGFLDATADRFGLTAAEIANPEPLRYWPIPSRMRRDTGTSAARVNLMNYLDDWHYGDLSSESHLSLPGLVMRSGALQTDQNPEELTWRLDKQRSDNMLRATVLTVAFASEIEIECRYGLAERLKYVWTVLNSTFGMAKELYDPWYSTRL